MELVNYSTYLIIVDCAILEKLALHARFHYVLDFFHGNTLIFRRCAPCLPRWQYQLFRPL